MVVEATAQSIMKIQSPIGELTVPRGVIRDYMGLREEAAKYGFRPLTGRELDIAVMHEPTRVQLRENAAWYRSGSIAVYRANGQTFSQGQEVVDSYTDNTGRKFVLLAEAIPLEAVGKSGVIFIESPVITMHLDRIQVSAVDGAGVFVPNVVSNSGDRGILDPETGLVVNGRGSDDQTRWFYRTDEDRIVPLYRDAVSDFDFRRGVGAGGRPLLGSGVVLISQAQAGSEAAAAQTSIQLAQGITLADFRETVSAATNDLGALVETTKPELLENLGKVLRGLSIY